MGPLRGIRVLELAGIGPSPYGCMLLADLGADVIRVERPSPVGTGDGEEFVRAAADPTRYFLHRGRRSVRLDLRAPDGLAALLRLVAAVDVLVEGYRPGVAERLGCGPEVCLARNPRLLYARMTGWGQDGPLAQQAGHDINYIAVAGVLDNLRRTGERPLAPLNIVGDHAGGMLLAMGVSAALVETARSGLGQVIDVAMVDAAALQLSITLAMRAQGRWPNPPGENIADSGYPCYDVFRCADGAFVSVGPLEAPFYREFLAILELDPEQWPQGRPDLWPALREVLTATFLRESRDTWTDRFAASNACVTPVLSLDEAPEHPHLVARGTYAAPAGIHQPAPAPRFSRTVSELPAAAPVTGADTDAVLAEAGFSPDEIAALRASGAAG